MAVCKPHLLTKCLYLIPVWDGAVPEWGSMSDSSRPSVPHGRQGSEQGQGPTKSQDFHLHWSWPLYQLPSSPAAGSLQKNSHFYLIHLYCMEAWNCVLFVTFYIDCCIVFFSWKQYSTELLNTTKSSPTVVAERMASVRHRRQDRRTM